MIRDFPAFQKKVAASKPVDPNRIAILIKTINRKHLLFPTIESIIDNADISFRLYIGDDGKIDDEQRELYALLQEAGHFVRFYESPIALTTGLNDLVRATDGEQFLLRIDDDFAFCASTRVSVLQTILELVPSLGAISGSERKTRYGKQGSSASLSIGQGFLVQLGDILYRINVAPADMQYTVVGGYRFAVVGHTRNFLLIRRRVLDTVSWNEDLVFSGEHTDFFLRLAKSGWLLGYTPDSEHLHVEDGILTSDYTGRAHELPVEAKERVFLRDYGVKKIKGINLSMKLKSSRTPSSGFIHSLRQRFASIVR